MAMRFTLWRNAQGEAATFQCSFRSVGNGPSCGGRTPAKSNAPLSMIRNGQHDPALRLDPYGSVFAVFPSDAKSSPEHIVSVTAMVSK